ncbi:MAG: head GIN domain-containing protein [Oceanihabitans sp.]
MKKFQLLLVAIIFTTTIQAQNWGANKVKGNGTITTITRTTANYDIIKCAGSMDFILVKGNEGKITIEGKENLLKHIITEVKNNTLTVKIANKYNLQTSRNKTIKITIPFQEISKVALAGSGSLWSTNSINAKKLNVSLAGSGDIKLDLNSNETFASLAGSGDITLKGKSTTLEANIAGSGDFDGANLQADNTEVSVTGSGDATVVSNSTLDARVTGSGDIVYKGKPTKEQTKIIGSGSISNN